MAETETSRPRSQPWLQACSNSVISFMTVSHNRLAGMCICIEHAESCTAKEVAEATTETPAILGKASRRRLSNLVTLSMCHDAV